MSDHELLRSWAAEHEGCGDPEHETRAEAIGELLAENEDLHTKTARATAKLGDLRLWVNKLRPLIADVERTLKP